MRNLLEGALPLLSPLLYTTLPAGQNLGSQKSVAAGLTLYSPGGFLWVTAEHSGALERAGGALPIAGQ